MDKITNIPIKPIPYDKVLELEMKLDQIQPVDVGDELLIINSQVQIELLKTLKSINDTLGLR